ncbi:MAG: DUF5667 domain-containing protein, partial [bacterium]|nr:DUF5667 domain-containing protein [bacterium]
MDNKKLTNLLTSLKDDQRAGGEFNFDTTWKRVAREIGLTETVETPSYTARDYIEYYMWQLSHAMLKPIAASAAVFAFAIIGWVSVANASLSTMPGERLYPVKLSMERAQLVLAVNDVQRADLRVEFASRRLEEMVLASAQTQDTTENVQLAVDRFKTEVGNIQEVLHQDTTQSDIARTVGRNVEVYSSAVAATGSDLSEEVKDEVEELLEETQEQVVEVIITTHEQTQSDEDAHDLSETLAKQINDLEVEYGDLATGAITTAKALEAEGQYRRAFQV